MSKSIFIDYMDKLCSYPLWIKQVIFLNLSNDLTKYLSNEFLDVEEGDLFHIVTEYGEYQALVELDEAREEFAIYEKICSLIIDNNPKLNEIEKTTYLRSIQRIISTMPYDCKIPRYSLNDEDFTLSSERKRIKKEIKKFMVSHGMKFRHDITMNIQYYELDKLTINKVNEFIKFYEDLNGPDDRMPSYVGSA